MPIGPSTQAAALMHSIARNHALIDGNKRLALASVLCFYGINGVRLMLTNRKAYDLVIAVADGTVDDVGTIARRLATSTQRVQ